MKRGQLQIQESMLVVMVFLILLILGLILFYRFTIQTIRSDIESYNDFKFTRLTETIPSMQEFRCSNLGNSEECLDLEKIKAFNDLNLDYFEYFGYANITILVVYPRAGEYVQVYYQKPTKINSIRKVSTPVSIYNAKEDRFEVGKLVVEAYK